MKIWRDDSRIFPRCFTKCWVNSGKDIKWYPAILRHTQLMLFPVTRPTYLKTPAMNKARFASTLRSVHRDGWWRLSSSSLELIFCWKMKNYLRREVVYFLIGIPKVVLSVRISICNESKKKEHRSQDHMGTFSKRENKNICRDTSTK